MWHTELGCDVKQEQLAYAANRPKLVDRSLNIPWLMQSESAHAFMYQSKFHSMIPSAGFNYGVELPNDVAQLWYDNRTILDQEKRIQNNAEMQDWLSHWRLFSPTVQRILFWTVRPEVMDWMPFFGDFNSPETIVMR